MVFKFIWFEVWSGECHQAVLGQCMATQTEHEETAVPGGREKEGNPQMLVLEKNVPNLCLLDVSVILGQAQ